MVPPWYLIYYNFYHFYRKHLITESTSKKKTNKPHYSLSNSGSLPSLRKKGKTHIFKYKENELKGFSHIVI